MKAAIALAAVVLPVLPAAAQDQGTGIAHTEVVAVAGYQRGQQQSGPYQATVSVNVQHAAAKTRSATYSASLVCPSPVAAATDETLSRSAVAVATPAEFGITVPRKATAGHEYEVHLCSLRVTLANATDPEDGPALDVFLPVRVRHAFTD